MQSDDPASCLSLSEAQADALVDSPAIMHPPGSSSPKSHGSLSARLIPLVLETAAAEATISPLGSGDMALEQQDQSTCHVVASTELMETSAVISVKENGKLHAVALSLMELSCPHPNDLLMLLDDSPPPPPPLPLPPSSSLFLPFEDASTCAILSSPGTQPMFQERLTQAQAQTESQTLPVTPKSRAVTTHHSDPFSSPRIESQIDSLIAFSIKRRKMDTGRLHDMPNDAEGESSDEDRLPSQAQSFADPTPSSAPAVPSVTVAGSTDKRSQATAAASSPMPMSLEPLVTLSSEAEHQNGTPMVQTLVEDRDETHATVKADSMVMAEKESRVDEGNKPSASLAPNTLTTCTGQCLKRSVLQEIRQLFAQDHFQTANTDESVKMAKELLISLSRLTRLSVAVLEYFVYQCAGELKLLKKLILDYMVYELDTYRQKQFWTPELDAQLRAKDPRQILSIKKAVLFADDPNYLYKRMKWLKELYSDKGL